MRREFELEYLPIAMEEPEELEGYLKGIE